MVFYLARNYLRDDEKLEIPLKNTHKWVMKKFSDKDNNEKMKIHISLKRLRTDRNKADYDDKSNNLNKLVESNLLAVQQTLETLNNLK